MSINTTPSRGTILVADDSAIIRQQVKEALPDYTIIEATNGLQVLELAPAHPELLCIVMDLQMPHLDGFKTAHILKSNFLTYHVPLIILTSKVAVDDMVLAVEMGIDDYMRKPFEIAELKARLIMNLRRTERDQNSSPLTKLPGNAIINRTITARLKEPLAVLYADLDNFKAYNDKYGFSKGDDVLKETARIIAQAVQRLGSQTDFVGHVGGDDFILVSTPEKAEAIATAICQEFDKSIPAFYDATDQQVKKIIGKDRRGNVQEFPLMSISIAIITNELRQLISTVQIAQLAAELKKYAKTKPQGATASNFVKDRRKE